MPTALGIVASSIAAQGVPLTIPGCLFWFDATDASSITYGVSPKIQQWADKSGNNRHMGQATAGNQPSRNLGGIKSDLYSIDFVRASQHRLIAADNTANAKPFSVFMVIKHDGIANHRFMLSSINNFGLDFRINNKSLLALTVKGSTGIGADSNYAVPVGVATLVTCTYSAIGELKFYIDKIFDSTYTDNRSFTSSPPTTAISDALQEMQGSIGEVLKYDTVLTDVQRNTIHNYLYTKWGITGGAFTPTPGWTPTNITNLGQWLDGSVSASIVGSAPVTQWTDQTVNARHMTHATLGPTKITDALGTGKHVLDFNGSQYLTATAWLSSATEYLMSGVVRTDSTSATKRVWGSQGSNNSFGLTTNTDPAARYGMLYGGIAWHDDGPPVTDTYIVQTLHRLAGVTTLYKNNKPVLITTAAPSAASGNEWLGGDSVTRIKCRIAEVLSVSGAVSQSNCQDLIYYLMTKWGITSVPVLPVTTGLLSWYDANDSSTFTLVTNNVSQWRDKSGANRHLSQTVTYRPTFSTGTLKAGLGSVDFNGAQSIETGADGTGNQKPFSIFVVCKHSGTASARALTGSYPVSGGGSQVNLSSTHLLQLWRQSGVKIGESSDAVPSNTTSILTVTYSGTGVVSFYRDGVAKGTATNDQTFSATTAMMQVGQSTGAAFVGSIGEVIKYDSVLSTADRDTNHAYLAAKWL